MREADVKSINTLSRKEIIAKPKDKMVLSNALISAPVEYSGGAFYFQLENSDFNVVMLDSSFVWSFVEILN